MPQAISEKYTWLDEEIIDIFADYCRVVFQTLGDKVKYYVTINEPWAIAAGGFDLGIFPPHKTQCDFYLAFHNILKAHAAAYRVYEKDFKGFQKGKVGLSLDTWWMEPADPNSKEDVEAARRGMEFKLGMGAYPLLHGCYPPAVRERIDKNGKKEGRTKSRLPHFSDEWRNKIKGTYDFFGLNHYSSQLVTTPARAPKDCPEIRWSIRNPGFDTDQDIFQFHDPSWPSTPTWWYRFVPWGFRKTLNYIKNEYGNPEVLVTENGCSGDRSELEDTERINFFRGYINEMLKAVNIDGCNVIGYSAWSLLDGWEWAAGNTVSFGVHHVDLGDPLRKRTPRASAKFLADIFQKNGFLKD